MDDWFALRARSRRGRSGLGFTFVREAPGPAIRAQQPYAFLDYLVTQNQLLIHRETNDPVYRGDVKPEESCAWLPQAEREDDDDLSDNSDAWSSQERRSSPETPRDVSPTVSEMMEAPPRRVITYTKTDKKRFSRAGTAAATRLTSRPARRSARLAHVVADADDPIDAAVLRQDIALARGHDIVLWVNDVPRPIIDRLDYVIAVVAGGPKGEARLWEQVLKEVGQAFGRMLRNGLFTKQLNNQLCLRSGIGYGEEYAAPHEIVLTPSVAAEVEYMRNSYAFNILSAYQNHLYAQFAPRGHASVANTVGELVNRQIVYPVFDNSVFTTTELNVCDSPTLAQKNYSGALGAMEAITVIGKPAYIVFWEDGKVMELRSGATVIFPAGTKRYSFMPVARGEEPFLFRQFCHGAVLRWVEKGGYSDTEFDALASLQAIGAYNEKRARGGHHGLKMFSKLRDVFVI